MWYIHVHLYYITSHLHQHDCLQTRGQTTSGNRAARATRCSDASKWCGGDYDIIVQTKNLTDVERNGGEEYYYGKLENKIIPRNSIRILHFIGEGMYVCNSRSRAYNYLLVTKTPVAELPRLYSLFVCHTMSYPHRRVWSSVQSPLRVNRSCKPTSCKCCNPNCGSENTKR